MRTSKRDHGSRTRRLFLATAIAVGLLPAARASAEITLLNVNGWQLSTDGRINNFVSVTRGNAIPADEPLYTGVDDERTADNKIASTRLRTGFMMNVLGFELRKHVSEETEVRVRVALWAFVLVLLLIIIPVLSAGGSA